MTPWFAFTASLVYCIGSDGEVDDEEVSHLITALGGEESSEDTIDVASENRATLEAAVEYTRCRNPDEFLVEAASALDQDQKLCILLNMTDSALSDGDAQEEDQDLILKFQTAFGVSDEVLGPLIQALIIKNDKSIFTP